MHGRIYTRALSTRRWGLSVDDAVQVSSWLLGLLETLRVQTVRFWWPLAKPFLPTIFVLNVDLRLHVVYNDRKDSQN